MRVVQFYLVQFFVFGVWVMLYGVEFVDFDGVFVEVFMFLYEQCRIVIVEFYKQCNYCYYWQCDEGQEVVENDILQVFYELMVQIFFMIRYVGCVYVDNVVEVGCFWIEFVDVEQDNDWLGQGVQFFQKVFYVFFGFGGYGQDYVVDIWQDRLVE